MKNKQLFLEYGMFPSAKISFSDHKADAKLACFVMLLIPISVLNIVKGILRPKIG